MGIKPLRDPKRGNKIDEMGAKKKPPQGKQGGIPGDAPAIQAHGYRSIVLFATLATLILAAYWRVLKFPFIQDDWGWLLRFQTESRGAILKTIFTFKGVVYYRPLAELYLYIMYLVFGANSLPFHVAALALHFASACLIVAIARALVRDELIAWASGFVYALAVAVLLESLLWAVGICDVGASFFFLLAILLFVRERTVGSAIACFVACLFKESAIVLPIILFGYVVIARARAGGKQTLARMRKLTPMAIVLIVMIVIKSMGVHLQALPVSDPYAVRFSGPHIGTFLGKYVFGMFQSFFPFGEPKSTAFKSVLVSLAIFLVTTSWLVTRPRRDEAVARAHWFVLLWLSVALLPYLFLRNRWDRYYAMQSVPAFIILTFLQLRTLGTAVRLGYRYSRFLVALVGCFAVVSSFWRADIALQGGLEPRTLPEGNNNFIMKAALVDIVHDDLMKYLPAPPHDAVIVLANTNVWAFNKDSGPRVWYGDRSLSVYPMENLKVDSTGVYIQNPAENWRQAYKGGAAERLLLDPAKLFGFVLDGNHLRPVKFTGMPKSTVKPAP